jgi:hypothetical protein
MIETMGRLRGELRAIPKKSAPYKREMKDAVDDYFGRLREVGIEA